VTTTLDWFGCATFRMRTGGLTIFLDAYIDRAANAAGPQPRQRADDVGECDWIVIGHAHFDHLYGAERIMANTTATLIGSYESVRVMAEAGVPAERMICVAGGETVDLGNGVTVSVYPSQHSCVWSHTTMHAADEVCLGDLGVTIRARGVMRPAQLVLRRLQSGRPGRRPGSSGQSTCFAPESRTTSR
jgi:L-ascorbate metabolism protein UlaG (beta-lactamase superfamily)